MLRCFHKLYQSMYTSSHNISGYCLHFRISGWLRGALNNNGSEVVEAKQVLWRCDQTFCPWKRRDKVHNAILRFLAAPSERRSKSTCRLLLGWSHLQWRIDANQSRRPTRSGIPWYRRDYPRYEVALRLRRSYRKNLHHAYKYRISFIIAPAVSRSKAITTAGILAQVCLIIIFIIIITTITYYFSVGMMITWWHRCGFLRGRNGTEMGHALQYVLIRD